MQYNWIYVYVEFSNREEEWSTFRGVCVCVCVGGRGGGALPYLAYIVRVFAAEYKVLRIKQGVVFYYFKSKILFFLLLF